MKTSLLLALFVPLTSCQTIPWEQNGIVKVLRGKVNSPSESAINAWVSESKEYWSKYYDEKLVSNCLNGHRLQFIDEENAFQYGKRCVRKLANGLCERYEPVMQRAITEPSYRVSLVSFRRNSDGGLDENYTAALVGHELGHVIMFCADVPTEKHHRKMNELGFPHR